MSNITVYPFGTEGHLPSSIGLVNDKFTGGSDKALTAEAGKSLEEEINAFQAIDLSGYTPQNAFINNTTQKWRVENGYTGIFIQVVPGQKYVLQSNASNVSNYAFLKSKTVTSGESPDFVAGGSRINMASNRYKEITVPADAKYLYVATHSDVDVKPQSLRLSCGIASGSMLDKTMEYDVDLDLYPAVQAYPKSDGTWMVASSGYPYFGIFIPCQPSHKIKMAGATSAYTVNYTFLKSANPVSGEAVDYATGYAGAPVATDAGGATVVSPSDANYLYVVTTFNGGTTNLKPSKITVIAESAKEVVEAVAGTSIGSRMPAVLNIGEEQPIIYTRDNTIIKYSSADGHYYLSLSKDLGKTWTTMENTHGNVTHCHQFLDGTILLCFAQYACHTKDFVTVEETEVYDYDGSASIPTGTRFYLEPKAHTDRIFVDGVEYDLFGDYILDTTTNPRAWYSNDNGRTIHAAFAFGVQQLNGAVVPARHIHSFGYDKFAGKFYIFTGDSASEVHILRGVLNNGAFTWEKIKTGPEYKLTNVTFYNGYLFAVTDYTDQSLADKKGVLRCPTSDIDATNFDYLFKATAENMGASALVTYFADKNGWRVSGPDVNGGGKTLIAKGDFNFVWVDNSYVIKFMSFIGPNNAGDIYCQLSPVKNTGWSPGGNIPGAPTGEDSLRLNRPSFNLTEAMRRSGATDFLNYKVSEF